MLGCSRIQTTHRLTHPVPACPVQHLSSFSCPQDLPSQGSPPASAVNELSLFGRLQAPFVGSFPQVPSWGGGLPWQSKHGLEDIVPSKSSLTSLHTRCWPNSGLRTQFSRLPSPPKTPDTSHRFGDLQDHPTLSSDQSVTSSGPLAFSQGQ